MSDRDQKTLLLLLGAYAWYRHSRVKRLTDWAESIFDLGT